MGNYLFCLFLAVIGGVVAVGGTVMLFFANVMLSLLLIVCGALTLWFGWSGMRELRPKAKKTVTKKRVITVCAISGAAALCLVAGIVLGGAYSSVKNLRADLYDYSHQEIDRWMMNDIPYFEKKIDECGAIETLLIADVIDDFEQYKLRAEDFIIEYAATISDEIDRLEPVTVLTSATHRADVESTLLRLEPDAQNYFGQRLMAHVRNYDKLKVCREAFDEALARCAAPCSYCELGRIACDRCGESGRVDGAICHHCDGVGSRDCTDCNGGTVYTYGQ